MPGEAEVAALPQGIQEKSIPFAFKAYSDKKPTPALILPFICISLYHALCSFSIAFTFSLHDSPTGMGNALSAATSCST